MLSTLVNKIIGSKREGGRAHSDKFLRQVLRYMEFVFYAHKTTSIVTILSISDVPGISRVFNILLTSISYLDHFCLEINVTKIQV